MGFESEKCQIFWIFTKFEDQGPEYEKDLGPGPPLRTVWPVPVQDRDSPSCDPLHDYAGLPVKVAQHGADGGAW